MMSIIDWIRGIFWGRRPTPVVAPPVVTPVLEAPIPEIDPEPEPEPALTPEEAQVEREKRLRAGARDRVADKVDDILTRLGSLRMGSNHEALASAREKTRALEFILGCDFHFLDEEDDAEGMRGGSEWIVLNPEHPDYSPADMAEAVWPVDVGMIRITETNELYVSRIYTVSPAEVRGVARLFPQKMVRVAYAVIGDSWYSEDRVAGLVGGRWRFCDGGMESTRIVDINQSAIVGGRGVDPHMSSWLHDTVSLAMTLALTERYWWHVALFPADKATGPRVLLPTNPKGCLRFFSDRDRQEGKTRRAALRHWVHHFYRESDSSGLAYVRDHLRGATEFLWRDLGCELLVSAFDLEKNEAFKQEADLWRARRKHNRVKVKLKR